MTGNEEGVDDRDDVRALDDKDELENSLRPVATGFYSVRQKLYQISPQGFIFSTISMRMTKMIIMLTMSARSLSKTS